MSNNNSGREVLTIKMSQKHKNVKHLLMDYLPDNRPITSLQIVEDYEK